MPTYQYSCTECGHFMEVVQSFSDDSLTVCPECEGRLRKVFNAVGVVFKGSGFYRNDSRAGANGTSSEGGGDASGGGKEKADAKPAAAEKKASDGGSDKGSSKGSSQGSGRSEGSSSSTPTPKSA